MAGVARVLAGPVAVATAGLLAAAALSAPGDPKLALRPADQAYARTIPIRPGELPGTRWTGKARDFSGANPACVVKHFSVGDCGRGAGGPARDVRRRERTLSGHSVATAGTRSPNHATAGVIHRIVTTFSAVLRRGRTVTTLDVTTNGPTLPQAELRRLAGKMAARMTRP